jgi:hypothetical protein
MFERVTELFLSRGPRAAVSVPAEVANESCADFPEVGAPDLLEQAQVSLYMTLCSFPSVAWLGSFNLACPDLAADGRPDSNTYKSHKYT